MRGAVTFVQNVLGGGHRGFALARRDACGLFWPNAPPPLLAIRSGTSAAEDGKPSASGNSARAIRRRLPDSRCEAANLRASRTFRTVAVTPIDTHDRVRSGGQWTTSDRPHLLGRPYTAPVVDVDPECANAPAATNRGRMGFLERETGFEPATLSLGKSKKPKK
jgi:hypothetical protein